MSWSTQTEHDYWCDILTGKYATGEMPAWLSRPTVIRAVQKPTPMLRISPEQRVAALAAIKVPDFGKRIEEAARMSLERFAREVREAVSLEHVTAALRRQSRVW